MANGFESAFQGIEDLFLAEIGELFAKAFEVAKGVLVNEADQAEKFEERVLQRRGRKQ